MCYFNLIFHFIFYHNNCYLYAHYHSEFCYIFRLKLKNNKHKIIKYIYLSFKSLQEYPVMNENNVS